MKQLSLSILAVIGLVLLSSCSAPTPTIPAPTTAPSPSPPLPSSLTSPVSAVAPTIVTATQPTQPTSGPGGSAYTYAKIVESSFGEGENKYYLFEPDSPKPTSALPLILLLHGYGGVNPQGYRAWINHLVQRGNLVIFPVYQAGGFDYGTKFTEVSINALKKAIAELESGNHTRPDTVKFTVVGYSAGGIIAANLASSVKDNNLPVPTALMLVAPGGCETLCGSMAVQNLALAKPEQLAKLDKQTRVVITTGDNDTIVFAYGAKYVWENISQIPRDQRDLVTFVSDTYGKPALRADHSLANRVPPNAHNFYGTWKLFDALQGCSFGQKDLCKYALGNTPAQRFLGKWSDGTPIKELIVAPN